MKLIVGLGNPGRAYKYSRHNIGFLIIDRLAKNQGIKIKLDRTSRSYLGKGRIEDEELILAKPVSYMNLSGGVVNLLLRRYDLDPAQDLLVVFDDLDLDWGRIRIRPRGSSGGHKGVESIIRNLGSSEFSRLRFGIGRPGQKQAVVNYVLSRYRHREEKEMGKYLQRAADCCQTWAVCGIGKAMNEFN